MALVVLLRGLNVGGYRTFRPSGLASQLHHLDAVNIGAAGTLVVRRRISRMQLRDEIARRLPFDAGIVICQSRDIVRMISRDAFSDHPARPGVVRFVSVLSRRPRSEPILPLTLPSRGRWLLKVLARDRQFVFGLYRRDMKVIGYLNALDRLFGYASRHATGLPSPRSPGWPQEVDEATMSEWQSSEHASAYLQRADRGPQKTAGYAALIEEVPPGIRRVLDLGSGDGRLLDMVLRSRPHARGVALDFSPFMLEQLHARFAPASRVEVVVHDLEKALPSLGTFDLVVSAFAIHHLTHARKRELYEEIWTLLEPGGVFCNLEHVASASPYGHERFLEAMDISAAEEDPSNKLLDVHTQLEWLREIGFTDVDCYWKWRELALLVGRRT